MPYVGKRRKKTRNHAPDADDAEEKAALPKCFVIRRGKNAMKLQSLVKDFRQVMMPFSAMKLRETRANRTEDFVAVAGHFGVSHLVVFTTTKTATYMKVAKLPQGPTLTFKVDSFSLGQDVRGHQKRQRLDPHDFTASALQVLSGFSGKLPPQPLEADEGQQQGKPVGMQERGLIVEMLRGMFPAIDVPTFKPGECRRAALFHYNADKDLVYFRHYSVARKETGLQKSVMKLLRTRAGRVPKMGNAMEVADWVLGGGGASDSEAEDDMELPSMPSSGSKQRTAIKLTEVGPRMSLQLLKIEENVLGGSILYHRLQTRLPTKEEVAEQKARQQKMLKERNQALEAKHQATRADKKAREKRKRQQEKENEEGDDGNQGSGDARQSERGKGKGKGKSKGDGKNGKGAGKNRGKDEKKGKGRSRGKGDDANGPKANKVLDRFHRSAKAPSSGAPAKKRRQ